MTEQERNIELQVKFFERIQKSLPQYLTTADAVADALKIKKDAAYRRLRGATPLSISEAITLCQHYGILFDSAIEPNGKNHIKCFYTPLNVQDDIKIMFYMNSLLENLGKAQFHPDNEMLLCASDIPIFNLSTHIDLFFFKFYSWSKNIYNISERYEVFIDGLNKEKLLAFYNEVVNIYQQTVSVDIWSTNTIDAFLNLLDYHYNTDCFINKQHPIRLCEHLLDLIDSLHFWTEHGKKYPSETPFKFFISDTHIENTFVLHKQKERTVCLIKLFTLNSLIVSDDDFCTEMESWLRNISQRATLISEGSARDRHLFFAEQREKIQKYIISFVEKN